VYTYLIISSAIYEQLCKQALEQPGRVQPRISAEHPCNCLFFNMHDCCSESFKPSLHYISANTILFWIA